MTLAVLVLGAMIMILNETSLSVALPAIMADFGIPATSAQWLTTGFMLTMAVVIPATGYLLERLRTRQIFLFAVVAFLVGTVVAAMAPARAMRPSPSGAKSAAATRIIGSSLARDVSTIAVIAAVSPTTSW